MVLKVARLRFYTETYTGKDKYEGRHPFKKRSSEYQGRQQRCSTLKEQTMAIKDNSRDHTDERKQNKRRKRYTQGDQKKCNKGEGTRSSIEERGQSNLGRRWSGIHRRKNLYTKQQEDQGRNSKEKP